MDSISQTKQANCLELSKGRIAQEESEHSVNELIRQLTTLSENNKGVTASGLQYLCESLACLVKSTASVRGSYEQCVGALGGEVQAKTNHIEVLESQLAEAKRRALELENDLTQLEAKTNHIEVLESQLAEAKRRALELENDLTQLAGRAENQARELHSTRLTLREREEKIRSLTLTKSWRITRPMRFVARICRGQIGEALAPVRSPVVTRCLAVGRRAKSLIKHLMRADLRRIRSEWDARRRDQALQTVCQGQASIEWAVMTPPHTLFVAHLIADALTTQGWKVTVLQGEQQEFPADIYVVICPHVFRKLPPGEKRIAFQMEQLTSRRWISESYLKTLNESLAVADYSRKNLSYLDTFGIKFPHVHYVPLGTSPTYASSIPEQCKTADVLFYGDSLSSSRRQTMIAALKQHFEVRVENDLFGEELKRAVKQCKVVVNIHYYENALLETPRLYECLSLGVPVVSECAQDQDDYPELDGVIMFFEEGSIEGMILAVHEALKQSPVSSSHSITWSNNRFKFMFERFLLATGFIASEYAKRMQLPLPSNATCFAISLPETVDRRSVFEFVRPRDCVVFDGIRKNPGWVGCGLSYSILAQHALRNNQSRIVIMEDDVVLPPDYNEKMLIITEYLEHAKHDCWDVFVGVIADLHSSVIVQDVQEFKGITFVSINSMTSTVFNIYARKALELLCDWDPNNLDADTNTIDRALEQAHGLKVVTTLPFFVSHREELNSTLWGFRNDKYIDLIARSEQLLRRKVDAYRGILPRVTELCT